MRVADGWLIRHGCDQYKAWRQHASQISDGNLYYRFTDKPGTSRLRRNSGHQDRKGRQSD